MVLFELQSELFLHDYNFLFVSFQIFIRAMGLILYSLFMKPL